MAKQKSITASTPTASTVSVNHQIGEAIYQLELISNHLEAIDSLLAGIDENGDDWPHAVDYCIMAIKAEVGEVRDSLGKITEGGANENA